MGAEIEQIEATDRDEGVNSELSFAIQASGSTEGALDKFEIVDTNRLVIKEALDREERNNYTVGPPLTQKVI